MLPTVVVKDGKLDNITLGQATEEAIKDLVELRTVETAANVIYVPAGTVLCVGDDQVELLCATTITMTGETIDQIFEYGYLSDIRANSDTLEQLLFRLVNFIPDLNQLNGAEIGVNVDFACTNSTVTVDPTCTEDGLETVITSCGKTVSEKVLPATGHTFVNLKCACGVEIKVDADTHEDSISEEEAEKTEVKEVTIVDDHKTDGAVATVKKEATDLVVTLLSDPDAAEELVEAGVISEETATSLIEAVEAGESIEAIISVEKITTVEDKTEANIESAAEKALGSEDVKVTYLDVTVVLTSKTTGTVIGEFHKLSKPITVTVALPEELVVEGAKYVVIRDHEGTVTALATVDNGDGTISFTTDQFSTYAIAYATPKAPETGDSGLAGLYAMLFALSAAALFLLKRQEA